MSKFLEGYAASLAVTPGDRDDLQAQNEIRISGLRFPNKCFDRQHYRSSRMEAQATTDPRCYALIRATEQVAYPVLPVLDQMTAVVDTRTFPTAVLSQTQGLQQIELTCLDRSLDIYKTDMGDYGDIAPVLRLISADCNLEVDGGFIRSYGTRDGSPIADVSFRTWKQRMSNSEKSAVTVWVLVGGRAVFDFPDRIPVPEGTRRPWLMEHGLRCSMGGLPALIRRLQLPECPEKESTALAIATMGAHADGRWLSPLRILLSLVAGTWFEPSFHYMTTLDGVPTWRRIDAVHGFATREPTPAINTASKAALRTVAEQFDAMLARCESLLQGKVPLDVAIQYILALHDGTEAEIRDMCSAIDCLAESSLLDVSKREFISKDRFPVVQKAVDGFLREYLPESESRFGKRVREVLSLAKTESSGRKQKMLWNATDIKIGKAEREALKHRHDMSHKGYIPFDYDDNAQWKRIFFRAGLLRTLANRALLSILGFTGEAVGYNSYPETAVTPVVLNASGRIAE